MKLFDVDGPIYRFMSSLTNVFFLSLCWFIGSIPIITIGVSTVALFDVTLRMVDDEEGYVVRQFWKAYKSNIKQGIGLSIITLLCSYIFYLDSQILKALPQGSIILMIVTIVTLFIFVFSLIYAFPLTARYENTLPNIMRNSFRISMKYFLKTIGLIVLVVLEAACFAWNLTLIFIGLLIAPACIAYTISVFAKSTFLKIEKDNKSGEYDDVQE